MCPTFGGEKGRREYRAKIILKGRQGENAKTTSVATEKRGEEKWEEGNFIFISFTLFVINYINELSESK